MRDGPGCRYRKDRLPAQVQRCAAVRSCEVLGDKTSHVSTIGHLRCAVVMMNAV